jgi:hypothetical protein
VRQRGGIARILELPDQLLVRHDLCRVVAPQSEELPKEGRLVDPREQQDVARKGRLDE